MAEKKRKRRSMAAQQMSYERDRESQRAQERKPKLETDEILEKSQVNLDIYSREHYFEKQHSLSDKNQTVIQRNETQLSITCDRKGEYSYQNLNNPADKGGLREFMQNHTKADIGSQQTNKELNGFHKLSQADDAIQLHASSEKLRQDLNATAKKQIEADGSSKNQGLEQQKDANQGKSKAQEKVDSFKNEKSEGKSQKMEASKLEQQKDTAQEKIKTQEKTDNLANEKPKGKAQEMGSKEKEQTQDQEKETDKTAHIKDLATESSNAQAKQRDRGAVANEADQSRQKIHSREKEMEM